MRSFVTFFFFISCLLTGCQSRPPKQTALDREMMMVSELYERVMMSKPSEVPQDIEWDVLEGKGNEALLSFLYFPEYTHDPEWLPHVEWIFLQISQSEDLTRRRMILPYLCGLATEVSLDRALEIAEKDPDPEVRAEAWISLFELMQMEIVEHSEPENPPQPEQDNVVQLTDPGIMIIHSCFGRLPYETVLISPELEDEIFERSLQRFELDTGSYKVTYVDRIPFLPFSGKEENRILSVRGEILMAYEMLPSRFQSRLREEMILYLSHSDPELRELAASFLEGL